MTNRLSPVRRRLFAAAVVTLAMTGGMLVPTYALMADLQTQPVAVASGSVSVDLNGAANISVASMVAGQIKAVPLTIKNTGKSKMRYALTATGLPDTSGRPVSDALGLIAKQNVSAAQCTDALVATTGTNAGTGVPATISVAGDWALVGSAAQGQQTGDRALNPGASEMLCLQLTLASDAPFTDMGKTFKFSLKASAEQFNYNP